MATMDLTNAPLLVMVPFVLLSALAVCAAQLAERVSSWRQAHALPR